MRLKDVFIAVNAMVADGIIEQWALGGAVAATFYLEADKPFHRPWRSVGPVLSDRVGVSRCSPGANPGEIRARGVCPAGCIPTAGGKTAVVSRESLAWSRERADLTLSTKLKGPGGPDPAAHPPWPSGTSGRQTRRRSGVGPTEVAG